MNREMTLSESIKVGLLFEQYGAESFEPFSDDDVILLSHTLSQVNNWLDKYKNVTDAERECVDKSIIEGEVTLEARVLGTAMKKVHELPGDDKYFHGFTKLANMARETDLFSAYVDLPAEEIVSCIDMERIGHPHIYFKQEFKRMLRKNISDIWEDHKKATELISSLPKEQQTDAVTAYVSIFQIENFARLSTDGVVRLSILYKNLPKEFDEDHGFRFALRYYSQGNHREIVKYEQLSERFIAIDNKVGWDFLYKECETNQLLSLTVPECQLFIEAYIISAKLSHKRQFELNFKTVLEQGNVGSWCQHIIDNYEKKVDAIGGDTYRGIAV
jgi:hypothetical protein